MKPSEKPQRDSFERLIPWHWSGTKDKPIKVHEMSLCRLDCDYHIAHTRVIDYESYAEILARLEMCVEALEYYAHPEHYKERQTFTELRQPGVLTEGGDKARQTLARIRGGAE